MPSVEDSAAEWRTDPSFILLSHSRTPGSLRARSEMGRGGRLSPNLRTSCGRDSTLERAKVGCCMSHDSQVEVRGASRSEVGRGPEHPHFGESQGGRACMSQESQAEVRGASKSQTGRGPEHPHFLQEESKSERAKVGAPPSVSRDSHQVDRPGLFGVRPTRGVARARVGCGPAQTWGDSPRPGK